jgi:hypothetical protein
MTDTTKSNATITITADSYSGPLNFLSHGGAFSYNGSDNVQATAINAMNPLNATGSGVDLLTGSSTGTSILDAGTNADIETAAEYPERLRRRHNMGFYLKLFMEPTKITYLAISPGYRR